MKIIFCGQCGSPVLKGDSITVVIQGLKALSDDGEYEFNEDFFNNQTIIHNKCLSLLNNNFIDIDDNKLYEAFNTIKELNKEVKVEDLLRLGFNKHSSVEDMIKLYFENV